MSHQDSRRRRERIAAPADRYVFTIALADSDVTFGGPARSELRGPVSAGTLVVARPGERLTSTSKGPCDFLQLSVLATFLDRQAAGAGVEGSARLRDLERLFLRDTMIGQVGRFIVDGPAGRPGAYAEFLSRLVVARVVRLLPPRPRRLPLPSWRLNKVRRLVEDQIAEPLRLAQLAATAGLSRMHFAAQFREATGVRPHEYVLERRVERAKELMLTERSTLVQVALDVGFQSQAHFCTIFRRFTQTTPSAWRRDAIAATAVEAAAMSACATTLPIARLAAGGDGSTARRATAGRDARWSSGSAARNGHPPPF